MKRLRAVVGLRYPDATSAPIVKRAGGISNLTPEQLEKYKQIRRKAGEFCDDVPANVRKHWLEKGVIEEVEVKAPVRKTKTKGGK
jgi:hypothetical protein